MYSWLKVFLIEVFLVSLCLGIINYTSGIKEDFNTIQSLLALSIAPIASFAFLIMFLLVVRLFIIRIEEYGEETS